MQHLVAFLGHEVAGCLPLLKELKRQGLEVDVMGPVPLMNAFYGNKEAFFNLHIGDPTLQDLKTKNPEIVLFDIQSQFDWLDQAGVTKVGWGSWLSAPGSDGPQLLWWPFPFCFRWGQRFYFGSGQTPSAVKFLESLIE